MDSGDRAVPRFSLVVLLYDRAVRLLVGPRCLDTMDQRGNDADGPEHGGVHRGIVDGRDAPGPRSPELPGHETFWERVQPSHVLWTIATVGLLTYATIRGMDATATAMLTGLIGAMFGPMMMGKNGRKP